MIRRRKFIAGIGGAAAWPLVARAQQPAMPVIGILSAGPRPTPGSAGAAYYDAGLRGLGESGFVVGRNVTIEYRWAEGHYDRLVAMAADLVNRKVAVIVATPSPAVLVAKAATTTIPIVFLIGADPVEDGIVTSLNRPGGNLTGASFTTVALTAKRLELLLAVVPKSAVVALIVNPGIPNSEIERNDVLAAASQFGRKVLVFYASTESDIEAAFNALVEQGAGAILLGNDPFLAQHRGQVFALAARHAIPAMYPLPLWAAEGGLMAYGTDYSDSLRIVVSYVGRILNGERPGDLPVQMPTRYQLVVNLKAAKAIGLTIPQSFLLLADEVIE